MTTIRLCILVSIVDGLIILLLLYLHHRSCKDPECPVNVWMSWGMKNDRNR